MKKLLTSVILIFVLNNSVIATDTINDIEISPPVIKLSDSKLKEISLTELNVESEVIANIATSTYELVFFNPNDRVLEGELVFSLFDGQNVIDYALRINGKYRQASAVPKAKAKAAFENTIRAQIDPALLEKTIGNNFKTRLYPIPPKGFKRIKIKVQETLENKNKKLLYRIPFVTKAILKKLKVNIMLSALNKKPITDFDGFKFDKVAQGYNLKLEKIETVVSKPITIELDSNSPQGVFVKTIENEKYLFSSLLLKQDQKIASMLNNIPRKPSNNITVLWSNSYSNNVRNIDKELSFLRQVLKQNNISNVQLIFFNNQLNKFSKVLNICSVRCETGESIDHLINLIKNRKFDGTNDYSQIDISEIKTGEILIFSNGIRTIHEGEMKNIDKPLTLINSTTKADTGLLKKYAKTSNGRFIDLTKLNIKDALNHYSSYINQLQIIATSNNLDKDNVYIQRQSDRINIVSKTNKATGNYLGWVKIKVTQGKNHIYKVIKFENPIEVNQNLESFWATLKIEKLSFEHKKNKQKIISLAKQYKVLTNDMSLIVLDRVQDYVRYEIKPPIELSTQYAKLIKAKVNKKLYEKEQALIESIKLLQKQKKWYQKVFDKTKPKPVVVNNAPNELNENVEGESSIVTESVASRSPVSAPRMVPRPAPPPRAAPKRIASKERISSFPKSEPKSEIILKSFDSKAIYIKEIKRLDRSKWVEEYYKQKKTYLTQPMFYVDVADLFYKNNQKKQALIILSNVLELDFENSEYLRVFAFKAMELDQYQLAIKALRQVKKLRPFEPQSARDLALAYGKNKQSQKALNELYSILIRVWDNRFSGVKIVAINELNHLLAKNKGLDKSKIDKRLLSEILVDLRIVINWSSDNTDIDLWVIDPYKEKTFYSNKVSRIGGKISNDMTGGYGPEEFMIKDAVLGAYKIQAQYYGNSQQKTAIPVTIRAEVYSNYAKESETQKSIVLRLENEKAVIDVGEFKYGN